NAAARPFLPAHVYKNLCYDNSRARRRSRACVRSWDEQCKQRTGRKPAKEPASLSDIGVSRHEGVAFSSRSVGARWALGGGAGAEDVEGAGSGGPRGRS